MIANFTHFVPYRMCFIVPEIYKRPRAYVYGP